MKTDCELLELAAKAAGYALTDGSRGYEVFKCKGGVKWNPLTDDGDALRLAHALGMQLNLEDCNDINDVRTDIVIAAAAIGGNQ